MASRWKFLYQPTHHLMPLVFSCGIGAFDLLFFAQFDGPFQVRRRPADSEKPTSKLDE